MQPQRPHMGLQHAIKRNLGRTWAVEISANTFGKNEFHELQNFYPHFFKKYWLIFQQPMCVPSFFLYHVVDPCVVFEAA